MQTRLTPLLLLAAAAPLAPALAQTDPLVRFDHRGGHQPGWGQSLVALGDHDGDGVDELLVGTFGHGGGEIATVHSGRTGVHQFTLSVPFVPLFFGDAITTLDDETGEGIREIVALGSHSGDPNSPTGAIVVYSGADGALLRGVTPLPGATLLTHTQHGVFSPGDVDGDGSGDLLCRTPLVPGGGQVAVTLISSQTGAPLFSVAPGAPAHLVGDQLARLSDHDGDGLDDFAVPVRLGTAQWAELRSSATGALLGQIAHPDLDVVTGNGEPFLGVADLDGDGLRELAVGEVFDGSVAIYSTADGRQLRRWGCDTLPITCFGSRLIEVGDVNRNGHPDLLALESAIGNPSGLKLVGLDPSRKDAILFEELIPYFEGGYSNAQRIGALPGLDPYGNPTFVMFEDATGLVAVMRATVSFVARK